MFCSLFCSVLVAELCREIEWYWYVIPYAKDEQKLQSIKYKHPQICSLHSLTQSFTPTLSSFYKGFTIKFDYPGMESELVGTIIFSTVGRSDYGFNIFSVDIQSSSYIELRLTDDISINFNGQFVDDHQTIVFISERTASTQLYLTCHSNPPQKLPCAPSSLFHDRPVVCKGRVYFVSAHEPPTSLYKSWLAIYSTLLDDPMNDVIQLTPEDVIQLTPKDATISSRALLVSLLHNL